MSKGPANRPRPRRPDAATVKDACDVLEDAYEALVCHLSWPADGPCGYFTYDNTVDMLVLSVHPVGRRLSEIDDDDDADFDADTIDGGDTFDDVDDMRVATSPATLHIAQFYGWAAVHGVGVRLDYIGEMRCFAAMLTLPGMALALFIYMAPVQDEDTINEAGMFVDPRLEDHMTLDEARAAVSRRGPDPDADPPQRRPWSPNPGSHECN